MVGQNHPLTLGLSFDQRATTPFQKAFLATKEILKLKEKNPKTYQLVVQNPDADSYLSLAYKSFRSLLDTVIPNIPTTSNKVILSYDLGVAGSAHVAAVCGTAVESLQSTGFLGLVSDTTFRRDESACAVVDFEDMHVSNFYLKALSHHLVGKIHAAVSNPLFKSMKILWCPAHAG